MLLRISMIVILLLGYSGLSMYFIINAYENYKVASASVPVFAKRTPATTIITTLMIESYMNSNPNHCCTIDRISLFHEIYGTALLYEKELIEYRKSTNQLYNNFRNIADIINSEDLCSIFEDIERNIQ